MAATYKDIRDLTGLSLATISKYYNGGNVREGNRALIEKAAAELGFVGNDMARGLRSRRSMTIGIVLAELNSTFYTTVVTGMEERLREAGYGTIIANSRDNPDTEAEAINFLLGKMVDGLMIIPVGDVVRGLDAAAARGVPVVAVDRIISNAVTDTVVVDNRSGVASAVRLLAEAGHTHIGLLAGPDNVFTMRERRIGFSDEVQKLTGRPPRSELTNPDPFTIDGGYVGFRRLASLDPAPTAVVCANYELTLGAIMARNELGDDAPQIVGFDNLDLSPLVRPRPSLVAQPVAEIASTAAQLLLDRMNEADAGVARTIVLSTELIVGDPIPPPPTSPKMEVTQ